MAVSTIWGEPRSAAGAYDEVFRPDGGLREHWCKLDERLRSMGQDGLEQRWAEARRLVDEHGLTYNGFADASPEQRLWQLDPLPGLLPREDWALLQRGLVQRAQLLDRILEDVYGAQELLWDGRIPYRMVFDSPAWLGPCQGLCVPPYSRLLFYAADLGRAPDGSWRVLRDRTQSPTGFGYALENRFVVARMFPELFETGETSPLSPFFHSLRNTLNTMASETQRIVLLTPGPNSRSYFEDAYLAQYLGCSLVEGADLTVRGTGVYLKMLDGLQKVDVVVRRVYDWNCDPLELKDDSLYGVGGLTQAVRSGNVVLANSLGSGWVESPALAPLLPKLCRDLLGQELILDGPPTWWCAEPEGLERVLRDFDRMVMRKAFPRRGKSSHQTVKVAELPPDRKAALREAVRREPAEWVGQEQLPLSLLPSTGMERHSASIRFFVANSPHGFECMPGGLVHVRQGGRITSKDLWWLREPDSLERTDSLFRGPLRQLTLTRSGGDLPSRAADNFFWLGRYLERVDCLVHLARTCLSRVLNREQGVDHLALLMAVPEFREGGDSMLERLLSWIGDRSRSDGLWHNLRRLQDLAGTLRDRLSMDALSILRDLNPIPKDDLEPSRALSYLVELAVPLWAMAGMTMESLHRGYGFRFLDLGRRLERAMQTTSLLSLIDGESTTLEALLEVCDSSRTYRRRYQTTVDRTAVLDLLLLDHTNPRAVIFQLMTIEDHLEALPRPRDRAVLGQDQRILTHLLYQLKLFDVTTDAAGLLETLDRELPLLSEAINSIYLTHLVAHQQLPALTSDVPHEV